MASICTNLLEQKKAFTWEKSSTPRGFSLYTNMAAVSLFYNTNMAAVKSCENAQFWWLLSYVFSRALWPENKNACKKSRWHSRIMKLLMNVELSCWLLCWPSLFRTTAGVIPGDLNKACGVKQDKLCVKTIVYKSKFCANHKLSVPLRPWYWKYNNLANLRLPRSP